MRLIAFRLLQINCATFDFRFLPAIGYKETACDFYIFLAKKNLRRGFSIALARFITDNYQTESSKIHYQFAAFYFNQEFNSRIVFVILFILD